MIFNSLEFAVFLPIVLGLFWLLPHRGKQILLLCSSYLFYGWWDWRFLLLLILSTTLDFFIGRAIHRAPDERSRKRRLWMSVVLNLGILSIFKYLNFFVDSANDALERLGLEPMSVGLRLVLPVGISFYTFQSLSYTFDVYRRRIRPERDWVTLATFLSFFPQLVAGPIERAHLLLPQFQRPFQRPNRDQVSSGCVLILQGLFKKVVIADALAPVVQDGFGNAPNAGWATLLVGVYAFSLQIYGDFSGYTDIARGTGRLFGIDLMRNFEQPYLSRNITEFWRRWHISLSTWLRDYLYVPLGGNRRSEWTTARNLMITMLLGGLWHGASATFVFWGFLHGVYLVVHRFMLRGRHLDDEAPLTARSLLPIVGTFQLVCFAWIFFRALSFEQAIDVITGIVTLRAGSVDSGAVMLLAIMAAATLALDLAQRITGQHSVVLRLPAFGRGVVYGVAVTSVVVFSGGAPVPFLYFQF